MKPTSDKKPPEKNSAPVDERNLVNVDDAFAEADLDDRLWLWWKRNGRSLVWGIALVLAVTVVVESVKVFQRQALTSMQDAYVEAGTAEAPLREFGEAHQSKPLGGAALLKVADQKYTEAAYSEAAALYAQAAPALSGTPLRGRALIGQGISLLRQDNTTAGVAVLKQVAMDTASLPALRAEAYFHLAVQALADDHLAEARDYLAQLDKADANGIWAQQVRSMKELMPELAEAETEASVEIDLSSLVTPAE